MPGGDGSGPNGVGPMTGRAAGYCAGYPMPGFANQIPGGGWGRGFGGRGGWGRRNRFYATGFTGWQRAAYGGSYMGGASYNPPVAPGPVKETELSALKAQAEYFEDVLGGIQRRIAELEGNATEE